MTALEIVQGTDEWFEVRLGKATASRIADIIAKTRSGPSASRKNYLAQLVAERLTGIPADSFTNAAMQWGVDTEPQALAAYELQENVDVFEVGFVDHPGIENSGASPDGLVGDDGMVEIKCPNTWTHLEVRKTRKIPDKYIVQMQWQMACADRAWCDFVSFDPRLPARMQLVTIRVRMDPARIQELEGEVREFLAEVQQEINAQEALDGSDHQD